MSDNSENNKKKKFSFRQQFENLSNGGVTLLLTMLFTFLVTLAACLAVFFASVQGKEKVLVPNVVGKPFTSAVLEMQEKELYPKLIMHYSDLPGEAGIVLAQDPEPGSIVKAYRRITLTVSRGVSTSIVENYVGKNLDAVKSSIELEFSGERPLLSVAAPVFQTDNSPLGTILAQYPSPDTHLSEPVQMKFVVSSGSTPVKVEVMDLTGRSIEQVLNDIKTQKVIYDFTSHIAAEGETAGTVTSVSMPSEKTVSEYTRIPADVALKERAENDALVMGLFTADVVEYPYPVPMRLETTDINGKTTVLSEFMHPGKSVSIPFEVKPESTVSLYIMDQLSTQINIH